MREVFKYFILSTFILGFDALVVNANVTRLDLDIVADPAQERMSISAGLEIDLSSLPEIQNSGEYWFQFTEPATIEKFVADGAPVPFEFIPIPNVPESVGVQLLRVELPKHREKVVLKAEYVYSRDTLKGFAPNPSTDDHLHLAQLRRDSIYSSHLPYYPTSLHSDARSARIKITVPKGWTGLTAGGLAEKESGEFLNSFTYEVASPSGRLPYPLAIYPYRELKEGQVSIFFSEEDRSYAGEKLELIQSKILPFLTNLMGLPPFHQLKVIEVFPFEGNTGLAARDVVMLSQKIWFASPVDEDPTSKPSLVLVDEIAHQWNFYKVQLPNYLAEGVSEYTDALFLEYIKGAPALDQKIVSYRAHYKKTADLLNQVRDLKKQGLSKEQIAEKVHLFSQELDVYWPYAEWGEVPISDERVFPRLYFLKGALALHALRQTLGKESFYSGFREVFSNSREGEMTLDQFRAAFEGVIGRNLEEFFQRWYLEPGLPE